MRRANCDRPLLSILRPTSLLSDTVRDEVGSVTAVSMKVYQQNRETQETACVPSDTRRASLLARRSGSIGSMTPPDDVGSSGVAHQRRYHQNRRTQPGGTQRLVTDTPPSGGSATRRSSNGGRNASPSWNRLAARPCAKYDIRTKNSVLQNCRRTVPPPTGRALKRRVSCSIQSAEGCCEKTWPPVTFLTRKSCISG